MLAKINNRKFRFFFTSRKDIDGKICTLRRHTFINSTKNDQFCNFPSNSPSVKMNNKSIV